MKSLILFVVPCCLLLPLSLPVSAAVYLAVDGQQYDTLALKTGQELLIEIRSDDSLPYTAYAGFDDGTAPLGSTHHPAAFSAAGNLASISPVSAPPLRGYYVNAAGVSPAPSPGLHFRFAYTAKEVGQTIVKLYDSTLSTVLDSIAITVESEQTGTGFTYQGRLLDANQSGAGLYDFVFTVFDSPSAGVVIAGANTLEDVQVVDGYFAAVLDFGDVFGSEARWLEIAVRPAGDGQYTTLSPRQRLTPAPQAAYAARANWNSLDNMPAGFADGIDNAGLSTETDPTVPASIKDGLSWSEILDLPAGFADGVDNGLLTETDPTVAASVKDGIAWGEIQGIPAGFADNVDNDTVFSETQIEGFIANDISDGYIPYDNGAKLVSSPFVVTAQDAAIGTTVNSNRKLNLRTDSDAYGFYSENAITYGDKYGVFAMATGNTSGSSYGLFGSSSSGLGHNFGVWGEANTATPYTNYGVVGSASNSGTGGALAGFFMGDVRITGILNKDYDLAAATAAGAEISIGSGIYPDRKLSVRTESNLFGIYSENTKTSGNNFGMVGAATGSTGGTSYGMYGASLSTAGTNFGVYGTATTASAGINYGVYGTAANTGGTAYAGYFAGDMRTTGRASVGTDVDSTRKLNVRTDSQLYGVYSENATGAYSENYAVYGVTTGITGGVSCGVFGKSTSSSGNNYGVRGEAFTPNTGANLGVYGYALNTGGGYAAAGYFDGDMVTSGNVGIGTDPDGDKKLNISADSSSDYYGVYSRVSTGGLQPGTVKYAVYGECDAGGTYNYGVYGRADTDTPFTNYGIYGYARNTTGWAWAGYFDGSVYVTNNLSAAALVDRTPYPKDVATAYAAVMSMERLPEGQYKEDDKEQQLDHSKLSPFIQSEDGHRDLSATVSCLNEVVKDLIKENQELKERLAALEIAVSKKAGGKQ